MREKGLDIPVLAFESCSDERRLLTYCCWGEWGVAIGEQRGESSGVVVVVVGDATVDDVFTGECGELCCNATLFDCEEKLKVGIFAFCTDKTQKYIYERSERAKRTARRTMRMQCWWRHNHWLGWRCGLLVVFVMRRVHIGRQRTAQPSLSSLFNEIQIRF